MKNLSQLQVLLRHRRANTRMFRRFMVRSSVAAIMRCNEDSHELEVLLIKRADRKGDRWSGHMAFPGGRLERGDKTAQLAAMRETHEEIGLRLSQNQYMGRLSDVMTLAHGTTKPMVVSPYVFRVAGSPKLTLNYEVAEVVWLPLSFLADKANRDTMRWDKNGVGITLPCYHYQGYRIWGLTLRMLDELVELAVAGEKH